jgi:hypothetical protein
MCPLRVTTNWLPQGRGELPQLRTTVANATASPAARHALAMPSMSSVSLMMQKIGLAR